MTVSTDVLLLNYIQNNFEMLVKPFYNVSQTSRLTHVCRLILTCFQSDKANWLIDWDLLIFRPYNKFNLYPCAHTFPLKSQALLCRYVRESLEIKYLHNELTTQKCRFFLIC